MIQEYAIRGLSSLLMESQFWIDFDKLKKEFFSNSHLSCVDYNDVKNLKGKSVMSNAYILALRYLLNGVKDFEYQELQEAIDCFHVGILLFDDYNDIREDFVNKQINYYIFKSLSYFPEEKCDSLDNLMKVIYASNIAEDGLSKSLEELDRARTIFHMYDFKDQIFIIDGIRLGIIKELHYIRAMMYKTKQKVKLSRIVQSFNTVSESILNTEVFIWNCLKNKRWEDFLTNAGVGKNWITAYVASMIGEFDCSNVLLREIVDDLVLYGGKYNDRIVEDADSNNFLLYSLLTLDKDVDKSIVKSWLSFQNEDYGFSTYHDDNIKRIMGMDIKSDFKGWFSSQSCVTAVACLVAGKNQGNPIFQKVYESTKQFLIKNQSEDGSWNSYWWTDNLYATCFSVIVLVKDRHTDISICQKAIVYILSRQYDNGSWGDARGSSVFYTALSIKALIVAKDCISYEACMSAIERGISWLKNKQYDDGSWRSSRILRLPYPNELNPEKIQDWRKTSFGLNCIVDDHNRIFTSATVLNALKSYEQLC